MTNNTYILQHLQQKFGSADWDKWSMHRWSWWDYVRLTNAGVNSLSFFSNPLGSTDPVSGLAKTKEQTNGVKARSFGQVYAFIQQIRTHIHVLPKNRQAAGVIADADVLTSADGTVLIAPELLQLAGMGVLKWKIGQKSYYPIEQPFRFCPPGFGVDIERHAASGLTESVWFQQANENQSVFALTPPQIIEPEQSFELDIEFPNANTPTFPQVDSADMKIDIGIILDGYVLRPAQ